ncbi:hypothetical protein BJY01DRAFT_16305 [Aspergillus pseudoustus]|uniref:C2H2-type domain-containing protein n=1 Tax=Aspergillus pseudoustus TaxID=1810923 RepID=A0ABR4JL99_9EURO
MNDFVVVGISRLITHPSLLSAKQQLGSVLHTCVGGASRSPPKIRGRCSAGSMNSDLLANFNRPKNLVKMTKRMNPISYSLLFAEAVLCRLNRIKTVWSDSSENLGPDTVLQVAVLLSNIEKTLGIDYLPAKPTPNANPTCVVCSRAYNRIGDLNYHIKTIHPFLRPVLEAKTCNCCRKEYNSNKKLVSHERLVHRAVYLSRAEFIWPGFIQLKSEEAQMSFQDNLDGDRQISKTYAFGETANMVPASVETCNEMEESRSSGRYPVNDSVPLQYDSEFYGDLESLIFSEPSLAFGSSIQFPPDYPF